MIKIFLDSNIWLRPLVENSSAATSVIDLFQYIESGKLKPYTSSIVLLEVAFVLQSIYRVDRREIKNDLSNILETKNLTLVEKTHFNQALSLHAQSGIKLADCLIATQLPIKTTFISFDQEFKKIPNLDFKSPSQLIDSLKL